MVSWLVHLKIISFSVCQAFIDCADIYIVWSSSRPVCSKISTVFFTVCFFTGPSFIKLSKVSPVYFSCHWAARGAGNISRISGDTVPCHPNQADWMCEESVSRSQKKLCFETRTRRRQIYAQGLLGKPTTMVSVPKKCELEWIQAKISDTKQLW